MLSIMLSFLFIVMSSAVLFADQTWTDRITIRQSTLDKNYIEKPATLQYIHSSEKGDSYAIDAGLTINAHETDRWLVGPSAEYHRKTETSKEQDNFQVGLTVINTSGDVTEHLVLYTQASFKYKKDKINTGEGLLAKINFTPLKSSWLLGDAKDLGLGIKALWQPSLGVQYETASDVLKTDEHGTISRAAASVEVGIYPFARALRSNLILVVRDDYWLNIHRTGGFKDAYDNDQNLFQASITYYFDEKQHFGTGIDYSEGENPEEGLPEQAIILLSLKIKF